MASGGIHLATGFAVGSRCRRIPTAFLAGVVSHAVLDALPHHDYPRLAAHAGDAAVGSAMTVALLRRCRAERRMVGLAGAVGAVLPDVESVLLTLGRMDAGRMRFPSHSGLIPHGRADYRTTLLFYAVAVAVSWVLVRPDRHSSRRQIPSERTYRNSLVAH